MIRVKLKEVMMTVDLEEVTTKIVSRFETLLFSSRQREIAKSLLRVYFSPIKKLTVVASLHCLSWKLAEGYCLRKDVEVMQVRRRFLQVFHNLMHQTIRVCTLQLRESLEREMGMNLKQYKHFIDDEMIIILRQMDSPSLIFDHLYLGSEWNASNLEELRQNG